MEIQDWLSQVVAGSIMVRDVVTLHRNDTLAVAADTLLRKQISGAPVVDSQGVCLGIISVSDLPGAEEKVDQQRRQVADSALFHSQLALPTSVYADKLSDLRDKIAPAAEQPVERFMVTDVVSVGEATSMAKVLRRMVDAHIHRVVVLDVDHRVTGIVTTIDVIASLLRSSHKQLKTSPSLTRDF